MDGQPHIFRLVTVKLPIGQYAELERKAHLHGISVEDLVTLLVRRHTGDRASKSPPDRA